MIYTYDSLAASLQSWREDTNSEFVASIAEIISLAELRVLRDLNLTIFDQLDTTSVTVAGTREVTKPDGWYLTRELYRRTDTTRAYLFPRSISFCLDFSPDSSAQDAPTQFAELNDTQWLLVATPDDVYSIDAYVSIRPASLAPANQENWIGSNVGDLLQAEALNTAAKYLKKPIESQSFEMDYQKKLQTARLELRSLIRADYNPIRSGARGI